MRPDRARLGDILEANGKIREQLPSTVEELMASELLQVWVVYHLRVIGEAANNLSPDLVAAHPEIPWRKIVGLRHVIVSRYFGIDLAVVWRLVTRNLPALEAPIRASSRACPDPGQEDSKSEAPRLPRERTSPPPAPVDREAITRGDGSDLAGAGGQEVREHRLGHIIRDDRADAVDKGLHVLVLDARQALRPVEDPVHEPAEVVGVEPLEPALEVLRRLGVVVRDRRQDRLEGVTGPAAGRPALGGELPQDLDVALGEFSSHMEFDGRARDKYPPVGFFSRAGR